MFSTDAVFRGVHFNQQLVASVDVELTQMEVSGIYKIINQIELIHQVLWLKTSKLISSDVKTSLM